MPPAIPKVPEMNEETRMVAAMTAIEARGIPGINTD
jgi:hypothetical protein